jgi:hypothetical protein
LFLTPAFKSVPQRKDSKGGGAAAARPKSPFERRTIDKSSVYSSEEERLFVENLVELVGKLILRALPFFFIRKLRFL